MQGKSSPHPGVRIEATGPFLFRGLRNVWAHFERELSERIQRDYPTMTPATNRLMVLIDADGTRIGDLAARAAVTKQSMAEAVAVLEERGLVERRPDPHDKRAKLVTLTTEGWVGLKAGRDAAAEIQQRWTEVIGERDMVQLQKLLEKLAAGLDDAR